MYPIYDCLVHGKELPVKKRPNSDAGVSPSSEVPDARPYANHAQGPPNAKRTRYESGAPIGRASSPPYRLRLSHYVKLLRSEMILGIPGTSTRVNLPTRSLTKRAKLGRIPHTLIDAIRTKGNMHRSKGMSATAMDRTEMTISIRGLGTGMMTATSGARTARGRSALHGGQSLWRALDFHREVTIGHPTAT